MKTKSITHSPTKGMLFVFLVFILCSFVRCKDEAPADGIEVRPPDANVLSEVTSYFPDSGGIATKIILHGNNFGTDTSYIKVLVNGHNATVIGSDGKSIYAIVPRQAGSGPVKVRIGKEPDVEELTYENEFKYQFRENVTTIVGQNGIAGITDGSYSEALLRRPWFVAFDSDGAMYIIDEGRGKDSNGGLRKAFQGTVSTIMRNSTGLFQSPTAVAFNLAQDTLFLLNTIYNTDGLTTKATVASLTRDQGFNAIKTYIAEPVQDTKATGLAVNPETGELFFHSQNNGNIYKYNRTTELPEMQVNLIGSDTEARILFNNDGTILYLIARNKHCIYKANYNTKTGKLDKPELFVGQLNGSGFENGMKGAAKFNTPSSGTVDQNDILFVADKGNHCIRKIEKDGTVSTYAGIPQKSGNQEGKPLESQFNQPECVTFNPSDFGLYVADRENHLIRRIMVE
jgi:sugar lactone lactonase YvrE